MKSKGIEHNTTIFTVRLRYYTWIILCTSGYTSHLGWVLSRVRGNSGILAVLHSSRTSGDVGAEDFPLDSASLVSSISILLSDMSQHTVNNHYEHERKVAEMYKWLLPVKLVQCDYITVWKEITHQIQSWSFCLLK